uniref:Mucin-like domain-containing protein n=1 Tax=Strongyloides papillosus TaxID=174720 RepID=A0A0N5B2J5_STREA
MKLIFFAITFSFLHNTHEFFLRNDRYKRQAITGWDNNAEPGYLPDYRGDKYTDPQRIKDTQALNKPFFDSIGGEPVYPGGVPPKEGTSSSATGTNTYYQNQQYPSSSSSSSSSSNSGMSSSYSSSQNQINSQNLYSDETPESFTSEYPTQIQRDYFVPNTYETSTTNYGLLNNGYVSSTTGTSGQVLPGSYSTIGTSNQVSSGSYSTSGPIWQSANPGFLPDYRGDKYTDPQRILDTQNLNKAFFESIGGEPVYPGGVPPKQNIVTSSPTV